MELAKSLYIIWFIFALIASIKSKQVFGFWINHYALTNFFWAFSLFISIYANYYIKPVSDEIYVIYFVGNIFFNLTLFTSKIPRIPIHLDDTCYSLKKRRVLEILVLSAMIPLAYENSRALLSGEEMWLLYERYWDSRTENSFLEEFYKQNIIQPLSMVLMATCMFSRYKDTGKYSKYLTLIIGISFAVLNMLMTAGGRSGLMTLIYILGLSYCAGFVINKKGKKELLYKLNAKASILFMLIAVGGIAIASFGRTEERNVISVMLERISTYPALFEGWYKGTDICEGYAFGLSMFETPINILTYPFRSLFGISFERISLIEQQVQMAPALGHTSNAVVSAYLTYMRDFGVFGVAIGPFLVGTIYNLLWRLCRKNSFLLVFYFTGIGVTCLDSGYPFGRGFMFIIIFVYLYQKYTKAK